MNNSEKCTQCQAPDCPNNMDSEERGWHIYPSYCLDIATQIQGELKPEPIYYCLPCAYKSGAVV